MRTFTRAVVAAAAVAGAMTAGSAVATAEPATAVQAGATTQAFDYYYGNGSGSTAYAAVQSAKRNAETWARFDGYDPFFDCHVVSQYTTKVNDYYYTARVTLLCY
jgi:hypothetical protein